MLLFSTALSISILLLNAVSHVSSLKLSLEGRRRTIPESLISRRGNVDGTTSLDNSADISYYANITLGGSSYRVLIDTGSSDLWVAGNVTNAKSTGANSSVQYAVGGIDGPIKTANLEFAGYTVSNQAFIEVTPDSSNPEGQGLIGLGPASGSNVYVALHSNESASPVLDRIFIQNTSTPNILTVLLGRTDDPTDIFNGDISIGEVLDNYTDVTSQPKLSVTSVSVLSSGDQHFQILLDADGFYGPDNKSISVTTEVSKTSNKQQLTAVVDTGFSLSQVPQTVADDIYSRYDGAQFVNVSGVGATWIVPCTQEVNMSVKVGGQMYPIHPMDATIDPSILSISDVVNSNGENCCIGLFQPISFDTGDSPTYDVILGMSFLRNVYALINFGDFVADDKSSRGDPYIQFLTTTNPAEAHSDFVNTRLDGVDTTGDQVLLPATSSGNSQTPTSSSSGNNSKRTLILALSISAIAGACLLFLAFCCCCIRRRRNQKGTYHVIGASGGVNMQNLSNAQYAQQQPAYYNPPAYSAGQQPLYDPHAQQTQHDYYSPWDHRT